MVADSLRHRNLSCRCSCHEAGGGYNRPIELPYLETFPGAACYQPIELPGYKAAPLQARFPRIDSHAKK
jgi:hypothetical protein